MIPSMTKRLATTTDGLSYIVQRIDIPLGGTVKDGTVYAWGDVVSYRVKHADTAREQVSMTHGASKTFSASDVTLESVERVTYAMARRLLAQSRRLGITR